MEKYFELISNLNENKISNEKEFENLEFSNPHLFYFFKFLSSPKTLALVDSFFVSAHLNFASFYKKKRIKINRLQEKDYVLLQCVFAFKSLNKTQFEMYKEVDKISTVDDVVKNHISLEKKLWIFFNKKSYPFCDEFRKSVFKFYWSLVVDKKIKENTVIEEYKTKKQWVLEYYSPDVFELENLKISFSPFKLFEDNEKWFLIGDFFTLTTEIFKKNVYSNKSFKLKGNEYLRKFCEVPLFFDEEVFEKILLFKNKDLIWAENKLKEVIFDIQCLKEEIFILKSLNKENYIENIKLKIISDYKKINSICEYSPLKVGLLYWLQNNYPNLANPESFINLIWENLIANSNILSVKKLDHLYKVISDNELQIQEIIFSQVPEKEDEIDIKLIESYVIKNLKKIVILFKNFNLTDNVKIVYGQHMNEIRNLEIKLDLLQKDFSKAYTLNLINIVCKIKDLIKNKKLYFPVYYDFRGRVYFHSNIGITNLKFSRYFFNYGVYSDEEIQVLNKISIPEIHKFNSAIGKIKEIYNITRRDNSINESVFWVLIALGKEFINKSKPSHTLEELFIKGGSVLMELDESLNSEKLFIVEYYRIILKSYCSKNIPKRFIHKDATASFIQNAIRILGPKNEKSLEFANLKSRWVWWDTYCFVLEIWKKTLVQKNGFVYLEDAVIHEKNLAVFTRNSIKSCVMTDGYESSFITKWSYFRKAVLKDFGFLIEPKSEIWSLFINFNKFLENGLWDKYYLNISSDKMVEYVLNLVNENEEVVISSDDSETNLIYYKLKNKTIDVIFSIPNSDVKIRRAKLIRQIDFKSIDYRKLKNSVKANWVHFSDAFLVRQINFLMPFPLFTIHDCFLVDSLSVSLFILNSNIAFKETKHFSIAKNNDLIKQIWSIFIFI